MRSRCCIIFVKNEKSLQNGLEFSKIWHFFSSQKRRFLLAENLCAYYCISLNGTFTIITISSKKDSIVEIFLICIGIFIWPKITNTSTLLSRFILYVVAVIQFVKNSNEHNNTCSSRSNIERKKIFE